ncbi:MAG: uroporphyrinogen-III C-methyltransferase [Rhodospirillales bacterium]|nr:uroporphyrinogen-III C-methyltransferase [Rhodospirillales bacterium]
MTGKPAFAPGSVWLVGAGPGDPGLLTLHAVWALEQADVVVHDALVDARILAMIGPRATVEHAGKRGGKASPKQDEITARLIELARAGQRVLRLKGGDPFLFGRGAEEALALAEAGIPFRVVPGITAGIGGLAYAGIPATAKTANSAITFVTGHDQTGSVPDAVDWEGLGRGSQVIVVYMPMRNLQGIVARLLSAGRSPDEPAAIVSRACAEDQGVLVTTLGSCVADAERDGVTPPALFVLGEVVRLREKLDWWGGKG